MTPSSEKLRAIADLPRLYPAIIVQYTLVLSLPHSAAARGGAAGSNELTPGAASEKELYKTGQGSAFQISAAYWAMVRSLENLPLEATFRIAFSAHAPGSRYSAPTRACAWQ